MTTGENVFKAFEILFIDDNIEMLWYIEDILKNAGYDVTCKENGEEGLMAAKTGNFDLILMETEMPVMDGFEACRKLKNDPKTRDIPVIFVSIKDMNDYVIKGYKVGAEDYIVKPFNRTEILTRIRPHAQLYRMKKLLSVEFTGESGDLFTVVEYLKTIIAN